MNIPAQDEPCRIGGWVPFSTVDYPGHLAAVIFFAGCPWRCPYCHNPHLRSFSTSPGAPSVPEVMDLLNSRRHLLEGVVFSGGEPLAQEGLGEFAHTVKKMGFSVGLHTAGIYPVRLEKILPLVDWVGLDMKAPPDERYDRITGQKNSATAFERSIETLVRSGVAFEIRTTWDPGCLTSRDIRDLQAWLAERSLGPSKVGEARPFQGPGKR